MDYLLSEEMGYTLMCLRPSKPHQPFDKSIVPASHTGETLLVGAVDNEGARRVIARAVEQANGHLWWLDSGNAAFNGQCLIGNLSDSEEG